MTYAILVGSDAFVGTSGILTYSDGTNSKEFFKVREINRARSEGSYIVIDCDIKDGNDEREVKLFKSRPVVESEAIKVDYRPGCTEVHRDNGELVIKIEEVNPQDPSLPPNLSNYLGQVEGILRITGDFHVGPHRVVATTTHTQIGGITLSGNLSVGTGGMHLSPMGFGM